MKMTSTQRIARALLLIIVTFASVTLPSHAAVTYNDADAIKKFMTIKVSAAAVCARSAEIARFAADKAAAEAKAARLAAYSLKVAAYKLECKEVMSTAADIYDDMELGDEGLSQKAFEYAWLGYHNLLKKGKLHKTDVLTICDFSQSSSQQRMYVIDVKSKRVLYRTYVAHGINSGEEFADNFSNQMESCKSSLGFYVTRKTYTGVNGLSLRIDGVDGNFNDNAMARSIVIHGAPYVSLRILHKYGVMGTTFGCPAIPTEMTNQIIPAVKNGSCFFIYYPSKKYLSQSPVLNTF